MPVQELTGTFAGHNNICTGQGKPDTLLSSM